MDSSSGGVGGGGPSILDADKNALQVPALVAFYSPLCNPHTLQNIFHQCFHCCDYNVSIHSQRVNEMAGKMKITLDFELTGEV